MTISPSLTGPATAFTVGRLPKRIFSANRQLQLRPDDSLPEKMTRLAISHTSVHQ